MDQQKLRAWYSHKQGLDGSLKSANPTDVLARAGWARSVGGVGPYLTLFSRAGISRERADSAVANLEIHELPSARACTYVLPAQDFALGLAAGRAFSGAEMKTAFKLGVTEKEIEKLCDAIRKVLGSKPLAPEEIREATGNASRSLGEEGKKKGIATTLPLALGELQSRGEMRRVPVNGRLDQQRYQYVAWKPSPLKPFKLSEQQAMTELARRYYAWIGPATLAEFQTFSGLGVKASKAAVEPLKLEPLEKDSDRFLLLPGDREAFASFKPPKEAQYALVSWLDSVSLLRGDLKGMLEPADLARPYFHKKDARAGSSLGDVSNQAIVDRGRLVGLWEFDAAAERIVWWPFVKKNRDLETAVARTEEYVRQQLGDARGASLDSPKSRVPRLEALRNAALRQAPQK